MTPQSPYILSPKQPARIRTFAIKNMLVSGSTSLISSLPDYLSRLRGRGMKMSQADSSWVTSPLLSAFFNIRRKENANLASPSSSGPLTRSLSQKNKFNEAENLKWSCALFSWWFYWTELKVHSGSRVSFSYNLHFLRARRRQHGLTFAFFFGVELKPCSLISGAVGASCEWLWRQSSQQLVAAAASQQVKP